MGRVSLGDKSELEGKKDELEGRETEREGMGAERGGEFWRIGLLEGKRSWKRAEGGLNRAEGEGSWNGRWRGAGGGRKGSW